MTETTPAPTPSSPVPGRLARLLGTDPGPPVGPIYAVTTATSALVALFLSDALGIYSLWAVVSATVVIQPDVKASVSATSLRGVANLIGAGTGALLALLPWNQPVLTLVAGLFFVAFACRMLGIDAASRSASVALVIVLLRSAQVLDTSRTRVLGVLLGCAVALVVTGVVAIIQARFATITGRGPADPRSGSG
jgi:uncharacterized membrane protein YgaE (UPF0421/DUF939 family)